MADDLLSGEKLTKDLQQTSKSGYTLVPFGITLKDLHVTLSWQITLQTSEWATHDSFQKSHWTSPIHLQYICQLLLKLFWFCWCYAKVCTSANEKTASWYHSWYTAVYAGVCVFPETFWIDYSHICLLKLVIYFRSKLLLYLWKWINQMFWQKILYLWCLQACNKPNQSFHSAPMKQLDGLSACLHTHLSTCAHSAWTLTLLTESSSRLARYIAKAMVS